MKFTHIYTTVILTFYLAVFSGALAHAQQGMAFGFKAGLNFSWLDGPLEMSDGMEIEDFKTETGFHVGALFKYKFTREFGLESGIYYSQKGASYRFDGPSYFIIHDLFDDETVYATGNRNQKLNITNGYLHIPLLVYHRFGRSIEVNAGGYVDFLVSSTAQGDIIFDGESLGTGEEIQRFRFVLGYKYLSDEPGEYKGTSFREVVVDDVSYTMPRSLGAYFFFEEGYDETYFNSVDLGLMGGARVFVNESLFLGLNFSYGLSDVTNNKADFSRKELDENLDFIFRDDKDRNLSIQASVGFSF